MSLGSRINEIRREKNLSIDDLCAKSGIPKGTLSKITAGIATSPTLDTVRAIAAALDCRLDDFDDIPKKESLSKSEKEHIKKYRTLDPYGKEAVDDVLDVEWRRCENDRQAKAETVKEKREHTSREAAAESVVAVTFFSIPSQIHPMSAGTGQLADEEYTENLRLVKEPPYGASYVARVRGDSMEPTYYDDDLVFVHSTVEIHPGQIGVFLMDGEQYMKELGDGELISHNPKYDPIRITPDIRYQGIVLGVCDASYFE